MNFSFSDDQVLLRNSVRAALDERCKPAHVRAMFDDVTGYSAELWGEMAKLGWLGLPFPEEHGGSGLGMVESAILLEELGGVAAVAQATRELGSHLVGMHVLEVEAAWERLASAARDAFDAPDRFGASLGRWISMEEIETNPHQPRTNVGDLTELAIPETLTALISARLDAKNLRPGLWKVRLTWTASSGATSERGAIGWCTTEKRPPESAESIFQCTPNAPKM